MLTYTDHLLPEDNQNVLNVALVAGTMLVGLANSEAGRNVFVEMMNAPIYGGVYSDEEVTYWSNHLHDEFSLLGRGNFLITTTAQFPTFYDLDSGMLFIVVMPGFMLTFVIYPELAKLIYEIASNN
jgi:hypothetical protein